MPVNRMLTTKADDVYNDIQALHVSGGQQPVDMHPLLWTRTATTTKSSLDSVPFGRSMKGYGCKP